MGGVITGSLALLADAGHMFTDVAGLGLAGLAANLVSMLLLRRGTQASLNAKGADLEVLGDLLGSIAVTAAAAVIAATGWLTGDPLASVLVALMILPRPDAQQRLPSSGQPLTVGAVYQSQRLVQRDNAVMSASEPSAALILSAASAAIGSSDGSPVTSTMTCGSSASTTVWPPAVRTTTLHGSSSPIVRSAASARCASGGLQAPKMR